MDKKTTGIVAYITLVGFIIALVVNSSDKSKYVSFHLRQMLGLILTSIAISILNMFLVFIPIIGWLALMALAIGLLVLWIMALMGAINEEQKEIPVLGAMFQDWFKGI